MKQVIGLVVTVVVVVLVVVADTHSQKNQEMEVVVEDEQDSSSLQQEKQDDKSSVFHQKQEKEAKEFTQGKRFFIPSEEWQVVDPDHIVLPGLHVRMNLETGVKEAKLLEGDDGSQYRQSMVRLHNTGHTGITQAVIPQGTPSDDPGPDQLPEDDGRAAIMRENIIEALKHIKNEDSENSNGAESKKKTFRSYEELKEDFGELNLNMETDAEILTSLMDRYRLSSSDEERATILEDLEYLVHQYDNAINFVGMGGLKEIILPGANSSSEAIKQGSFHLLGSAVQSNPKVQIAALEAGLVETLIRTVAYDTKVGVARKAVFALSCLIRGFPYGQQILVQHGGLEVLRRVFDRRDFQFFPIQLKVVALLHDLLVEREEAVGERLQQLHKFKIDDHLATGGWCPAVSSMLAAASFDRRDRRYDMGAALRNEMPLRPDHDTVDKVVSAMRSMVKVCRYQFYDTLPLLRHLGHTYDDLAYKEQFQDSDDGGQALFRGLADTIQSLVRDIGHRTEL